MHGNTYINRYLWKILLMSWNGEEWSTTWLHLQIIFFPKIKLPKKDEKYTYNQENKNIVKVEIDRFPIAQDEGLGHVIKEPQLNTHQELDTDFVLSKCNIVKLDNQSFIESKNIENSLDNIVKCKNFEKFKVDIIGGTLNIQDEEYLEYLIKKFN